MDFSQPSDARNLALVIDGQKLWVSRETLALYSPVFNTMFYGDFRESSQYSIALPGKRLADFQELMLVLMPPILKPVDADNVDLLLELAREYSIDKLKERCIKYLELCLDNSSTSRDQQLDILVLVCKYRVPTELFKECMLKVAQLPRSLIDSRQNDLPNVVLMTLYEVKLRKLNKYSRHVSSRSSALAEALLFEPAIIPTYVIFVSLLLGIAVSTVYAFVKRS